MQTIRMTSRKYNGRLRDAYKAFLYAEDDERLAEHLTRAMPRLPSHIGRSSHKEER